MYISTVIILEKMTVKASFGIAITQKAMHRLSIGVFIFELGQFSRSVISCASDSDYLRSRER